MKKNILIVTDIPFMNRMKGNTNRIKSYYEYLKKDHNVDVLFLTDKHNPRKSNNIYYYDNYIPYIFPHQKEMKFKQPKNISNQVSYLKKLCFDNFIKLHTFDYIIIPYIWLSYLIEERPKTSAKFIIDTHDCMSSRTKSFKEAGYEFSSTCSVEEEKQCLQLFDFIMAISEDEAEIFRGMGFNNVFVAKYYYQKPKPLPKIGFIGSESVHNINAIDWFYDNCFKGKLDKAFQLYVMGDICYQVRERYHGRKNVCLYNPIYNIEDCYNLADIFINPCQFGSGLKIKNIEAITFGKQIVTTSLGAQGMRAEVVNGLLSIADTPEDFIKEITRICVNINIYDFLTSIGQPIFDFLPKYNEKEIYKELDEIIQKKS